MNKLPVLFLLFFAAVSAVSAETTASQITKDEAQAIALKDTAGKVVWCSKERDGKDIEWVFTIKKSDGSIRVLEVDVVAGIVAGEKKVQVAETIKGLEHKTSNATDLKLWKPKISRAEAQKIVLRIYGGEIIRVEDLIEGNTPEYQFVIRTDEAVKGIEIDAISGKLKEDSDILEDSP